MKMIANDRRGWRLAGVAAVCFASVTVAAPPSGRIDPDDPPKGLFADDWYAVTLRGRKCGYMHSTMTRKADAALGHHAALQLRCPDRMNPDACNHVLDDRVAPSRPLGPARITVAAAERRST